MKESKSSFFGRFAKVTSNAAGRPLTFGVAISIVFVWACSGPLFGFSDTWQLVINTGTTIITFLMVFLIQNSQNRDSLALQIKLDELIRIHRLGNNELLDLEELDEEDINAVREEFIRLAKSKRLG